jgi:hypothetical protein
MQRFCMKQTFLCLSCQHSTWDMHVGDKCPNNPTLEGRFNKAFDQLQHVTAIARTAFDSVMLAVAGLLSTVVLDEMSPFRLVGHLVIWLAC